MILHNHHSLENIAILVNPLSGKGKAQKIGLWLIHQLTIKQKKHTFYSSQWPERLEGFSEIWLVGGDGTINYFLNCYRNNTLPLAFFKGGTGNDLAWKLYGDITLEQQFEIAMNAIPRSVDAATCNGKIFVNSAGIGFDGQVLRSINTIRWLGGHLGYLAIIINKIFTFKEHVFKIHTEEKEFIGKFLLVVVNNSSRTGGGFLVTPKASLHDGKLDLLLCRPLSIFKRLRYLPIIEKGKHLHLPFISYSHEQHVHIETGSELYAQLDGELIKSKVFDLHVLPGKLLVKY